MILLRLRPLLKYEDLRNFLFFVGVGFSIIMLMVAFHHLWSTPVEVYFKGVVGQYGDDVCNGHISECFHVRDE